MYFPFFELHSEGKRSAEARSRNCAVLPLYKIADFLRNVKGKRIATFPAALAMTCCFCGGQDPCRMRRCGFVADIIRRYIGAQ